MYSITPENLTDGGKQDSLLTAKLRVEGCDGKMLFYKMMYLANILIQASAAGAPDKAAFATATTFCATDSNLDFFIKKF